MPALTRATFHQAVEDYPIGAQTLDADTIRQMSTALSRDRMLIVGELHGVAETPAIVYGLVRETGARALGLELPKEEFGAVVHALLAEDRPDWDALWSHAPPGVFLRGDGRVTAGHFALVRQLAVDGQLEQVVLFDAPGESRDNRMAERLLTDWDRRLPIVVLVGAAHAVPSDLLPNIRGLLGGSADDLTMADQVALALPRVSIASLEYASGHGWHHGEYPIPSYPPHRLSVLRASTAHSACVPSGGT